MRWLRSAPLSAPVRLLGVVLTLTLLVVGAGAGLQFAHANSGADANAPSVAGLNDGVIAHGVSALPSGQIAWQVVQATAPPPGEGTAKPRMLGFPLAIHDAVLITDQASGQQTRLAQWEAAFTSDGAMQRRESLASGPVTYDQIAPVPASAAHTTSGSSLLFAGDPFAAPTGQRDLDLVKGHLFPGNASEQLTTDPGTPLVILVLQGSLAISTDQGTHATLLVGQAGSYSGAVTLTTHDTSAAGTTFVAGIIGPQIPAAAVTPPIVPATAQATATGQSGSGPGEIIVAVYGCPAGTSTPTAAACPLLFSGYGFGLQSLTDKAAPLRSLADATPIEDGGHTWSHLPFGDYDLVESPLPPGYVDYMAPGYERIKGSAMTGLKVTISASAPYAVVKVFDLASEPPTTAPPATAAAQTTSLTVRIFNCPPGNTGNPNADVTSCTPATSDVAVTLTTPGGQSLTLADGTSTGPGVWQFNGLDASAGYTLQETQLPAASTGDTAWLIQSHGSMVQITGAFGLIQPGGNRIDIYNIQGDTTPTSGAATPVSS